MFGLITRGFPGVLAMGLALYCVCGYYGTVRLYVSFALGVLCDLSCVEGLSGS